MQRGGDEVDDLPQRRRGHQRRRPRAKTASPVRATAPLVARAAPAGRPEPQAGQRGRSASPSASPAHAQHMGAAQQRQHPGVLGGGAGGGLEAELRRPGDQRAEQQLVVGRITTSMRQDRPEHRADVLLRPAPARRRSRCRAAVQVLSPTVIASDATTKNQPPDIDIMVFHTRPGMANGTSSRQKRCQGDRRKLRAASSRSAGTVVSDW